MVRAQKKRKSSNGMRVLDGVEKLHIAKMGFEENKSCAGDLRCENG